MSTEQNLEEGRCQAVKAAGERCGAMAIEGSVYCFFHDPSAAKQRKAAQSRGGQANRAAVLPAGAPDVPLRDVREVAALVAEIINEVRKGKVAPKIATTVGYLAGTLMKALEVGSIEERLSRLEKVLKTRRPEESLFDPDADPEEAGENGSKP